VNLNNQKELIDKGLLLPLMESFYTIQGEGYHKGSAAFFIRLGGCDVGCHWCDVKESWDSKTHPSTSINDIVSDVIKNSDTVVITGGEPLMWDMSPITKLLRENNIRTHIETSGAYKLSGDWDWICLSPKKNKNPINKIYSKADELKMVIYNLDDLKFAENESKKVSSSCLLYLQPEWSKREKVMPIIVDYVMKNPKWKVSLQTHKYLNIP
jgi:7-carboxy-7-deazaguanine synthase|tara:strand:- start:1151 stop:1783 length:633 start_codon:yes stop_codon:yes gene_type:complete